AAWCLGLPSRVDETRENPGGSPSTRTVTFGYYGCAVNSQKIGPVGSNKRLTTSLAINNFGNVTERTEKADTGPTVVRKTKYEYDSGQYHVSREVQVVAAAQYDDCGIIELVPQTDLA